MITTSDVYLSLFEPPTGIEPATFSLQGSCSGLLSYGGITAYNVCHSVHFVYRRTLTACVGREGFEPPKSKTNVLQTPCVEPLAYLPNFSGAHRIRTCSAEAPVLQTGPTLLRWRYPRYRVVYRFQIKSLMIMIAETTL